MARSRSRSPVRERKRDRSRSREKSRDDREHKRKRDEKEERPADYRAERAERDRRPEERPPRADRERERAERLAREDGAARDDRGAAREERSVREDRRDHDRDRRREDDKERAGRDRDREKERERDRRTDDRRAGDDRRRDRDPDKTDRERPRGVRESDSKLATAAAAMEEDAAGQQQPTDGTAAADGGTANGAAKDGKKEPLSLEELLKKRQAEQEAQAKPVFLTKKQREELALQRRQQEVDAQRERMALLRQGLAAAPGGGGPSAAAPAATQAAPSGRDDRPAPRNDRRDDRRDERRDDRPAVADPRMHPDRLAAIRGDRRDDRRDDRDRDRDDRGRDSRGGRQGGEGDRPRYQEDREKQRELEMIKQQYLGTEKQKKKVLKASERFKFTFDWDAKEDTSRDLNPLYQNLHEANLLFGRGFRAGIDRREQKKQAAEAEAEMLRKLRESAGIKETAEDRERDKARAEFADKYDMGGDMKIDKHWTEKKREQMTERDWRIFREDFNISYKGSITNEMLPFRNWDEMELPKPLQKAIEKAGYKKPSPIQMAAIPIGLQQRDVIGIAETGSGKTAAFVLPMLIYIMKQPRMLGNPEIEAMGPYAVVLAPTRELAQQIEEEAKNLCEYTEFRVVSVVGGQSIEDQGFQLRKGCEIVVATPGRLVDCVERSYAVLNQCNYVVLDEADRMIDLGFEPQVMAVLDAMPSTNLKPENEDAALEADKVYRTTYMFSATMPPSVERLARKYLRRPIVVTVGAAGKATENVTQRVIMCKENEKPRYLSQEVETVGEQRIIVFVNTKKQCDNVTKQLENMDYHVTMLHGGKTQDQREESIKGFREGTYNVLVATDVAGRGIDVANVALVVNYDMPNTIDQYTHRIGRTGRAGKKGVAVTLLTTSDSEVFYDLKNLLEESRMSVPPQLAQHEAAKQKPGSFNQKRDSVVFAKK